MRAWRPIAAIVGVLVAAVVVGVFLAAEEDVDRARGRLEERARIVSTPAGSLQYAISGRGAPVLVVHGAGGGFDQGLLIARHFGGEGFQWISPSRFGYLGSALPPDASTSAQADAFAVLLDELDVERVSILAFSGGVPPALQFAERYPERTQCLALLSSAPFDASRRMANVRPIPDWLYQALFGSDAVYWLLTKTNRAQLEQAFDARPELRPNLAEQEEELLSAIVDGFLPASSRIAGVRNEGAAIDPATDYRIEAIHAPMLIIHARDDRINAFAIGEEIAARAPQAQFAALERGGHLLLHHHDEVRARVGAFLSACPSE